MRKPAKRFVGPATVFVPDGVEQHFRLEYFKALDTALSQLSSRMEQDGMQNYIKLEQCLLMAEVQAPEVCSLYPELDVELLQVQLPMFKQSFEYTSTDEAATAMRMSVPEVRRLFWSSGSSFTLTAGCSRHVVRSGKVFLRRLKMWLLSTMTQRRLNSITVCHVHQKYIDEIDSRTLLNEFVSGVDRRIELFGKF